jgi:hypothetical protein
MRSRPLIGNFFGVPGWNPLADFQRIGNSTHRRRRTHFEEVGRPCMGQTVTRDPKEDLEKPVQVGAGGCPIQLPMSTHAANKPLDQGLLQAIRPGGLAREGDPNDKIFVEKIPKRRRCREGSRATHRARKRRSAAGSARTRHLFWKPASSRDTRERGGIGRRIRCGEWGVDCGCYCGFMDVWCLALCGGVSAVADAGSFEVRSRPTKLLLCVLLLCFAWFHATASPTLNADRLFLIVMS